MTDKLLRPNERWLRSPNKAAPNVHACYHCDRQSPTNQFCENWRVWSCLACLKEHHRAHHTSCVLEVPKDGVKAEPRHPSYFIITVTRYNGNIVTLRCRLGEKLLMEDHWLGTYILSTHGLLLVNETRDLINERILKGLRQVNAQAA